MNCEVCDDSCPSFIQKSHLFQPHLFHCFHVNVVIMYMTYIHVYSQQIYFYIHSYLYIYFNVQFYFALFFSVRTGGRRSTDRFIKLSYSSVSHTHSRYDTNATQFFKEGTILKTRSVFRVLSSHQSTSDSIENKLTLVSKHYRGLAVQPPPLGGSSFRG